MSLDPINARDDFEHLLASIDGFIEEFVGLFPDADQERLDYSPASLDLVEAWILDNYPDTEAAIAPSEAQAVNRAACYVGEVLRQGIEGQWSILLDDPSNVYYGLPVVILPPYGDPACPLSLVTASANRRTGSFLRELFEARARKNDKAT